ncbi:MAG: ABC transporter ATP-binding protein [Candidatus Hydrogenedentes bacterium]|nr:ABC transporter ATP-binding protein [Candidatus Hydrogenedentota bacterium]
MILLDNVSKQFVRGKETVFALDAVSLRVEQGQLALLCGASGSGKTTLINLCAGLASPSKGTLHIADNKVHAMRQAERAAMRAQQVAVVFQLFHLIPYLSAVENILLPSLTVSLSDPVPRAMQLMEQLGIVHRINHRPGEMSAGERQRCAIARALLTDPAIILADEPTGNLDKESAAMVLETLDTCRKKGTTILLVSHQAVDTINPDIMFQLDHGKLVKEESKP